MAEINNDLSRNKRYLSKSSIKMSDMRKRNVPKHISMKQIKNAFDKAPGTIVKTGVPFNQNYQRHTKYVTYRDLFNTIKDLYEKDKL